MDCKERLQAYFQQHDVPFETANHPEAYTAQKVAAALHVSGHQLAKVVMVWAGDDLTMTVVRASDRVDLQHAADVLGVDQVRLAQEAEFAGRFDDCKLGAMPPFGNLYDLPVVVDPALTECGELVFSAGTYSDSMKIAYSDFERLAQPQVAKLVFDQPIAAPTSRATWSGSATAADASWLALFPVALSSPQLRMGRAGGLCLATGTRHEGA